MTGAPEKAQYVLRFDITGQSIDSKPFQGCNFSRKRRFLFGFGFLPLINEQSALFSLQPSSQLSRTCNLTVEIDQ